MRSQKKFFKTIKKYTYLFSIFIIFSSVEIGALAKNISEGQCNRNYLKTHLFIPFWEEKYQNDTNVVCAKEDSIDDSREDITIKADTPTKVTISETLPTAPLLPALPKESEDMPVGITHFLSYTPQDTQSPYYTDRGKIPLTTEYPYDTVDDSYFLDAAFIGDSRTLGLYDYSGWKDIADFYCESGFSLYQWTKGASVTYQNTGTKVDLYSAMKSKSYGKIYIMIGMNDLGYGNSDKYAQWLSRLVEMVKETQPDAIIYLMGNLHMSKEKHNMKTECNNVNINDKNVSMASLADGVTSFYLDCNPIYTDEEGYLKSDLTFDGYHIYGYCYKDWSDFIKQHAIIK